MSLAPSWTLLQLAWLCLEPRCLHDYIGNEHYPLQNVDSRSTWDDLDYRTHEDIAEVLSGNRVLRRRFDYGAAAYVISRAGMRAIMEQYFTVEGRIKPLLKGSNLKINALFALIQDCFVVSPPLFTVYADSTTIGEGDGTHVRLLRHKRSNTVHIHKTLELYLKGKTTHPIQK